MQRDEQFEDDLDLEESAAEHSVSRKEENGTPPESMEQQPRQRDQEEDDGSDEENAEDIIPPLQPQNQAVAPVKRKRSGIQFNLQNDKRQRVQQDEGSMESRIERIEKALSMITRQMGINEEEEEQPADEDEGDGEQIPLPGGYADESGDQDRDRGDDDRVGVSSHPPSVQQLSARGKAAREILVGHFGPLENFLPLTFTVDHKRKEEISDASEALEPFFPKIRKIEKAFKFKREIDREKETLLQALIVHMRGMYEVEMGAIYNITNGNQKEAMRHLLQLTDLTLDCASNANMDRLKIRSGPAVVDMIRHADEEEVVQPTYKKIIEKKAKEANELNTLVRGNALPTPVLSLPKWGVMHKNWNAPPFRSGSRGGKNFKKNRSTSAGVYPQFPVHHQAFGKLVPKEQQVNKQGQARKTTKFFPGGSGKG
jgi:hypothetical protein